ncbi:Phage head morphogenesis domain containing protein [uncultured Caudovirales phage]|uniref:Phage head morphogenesis domain containing protein n=1 Tax=uncultured Caudovirales phage TaxID=2100421 RepID=A0A6J5KNP3_9CAUD|nr:Phage head morphogenesis domain containing protein [uncultured Caudovirales phage]CAB4123863.1 Phage head morphogenesis domain containing protein [uncultured Caudovirales phage]
MRRQLQPAPLQRLRPRLISPQAVVFKAKDDRLSEAEKLAKKLEPSLAKAIFDLLSKLRNAADIDAIMAALQSGDVGKVISAIASMDIGPQQERLATAIQDAVWGGGALAATEINRISGAHFIFDKLNPRLITWLKTYDLNLIRQITDETKEVVREKLITGMTAGENPVAVAKEIKGAIGLTQKQAKAVSNFRRELETFHLKTKASGYNLGAKIDRVNGRQVFKPSEDGTPQDGIDNRRLRDFRYDGQLKRAMDTSTPLSQAQIDKMVDAYEKKYLAFRAQTIARTEALRTTNYGVQDGWRQAVETGKANETLVRRKWVVAVDERLCEVCSPIPGMNPQKGVKFDQPFGTPKGPVMLPPIHPNCRCTIFMRQYEPEQLA